MSAEYEILDVEQELPRPSSQTKVTTRYEQKGGKSSSHKYQNLQLAGQENHAFESISLETLETDGPQSSAVHENPSFEKIVNEGVPIFSIFSPGTQARTLLTKKLPQKGTQTWGRFLIYELIPYMLYWMLLCAGTGILKGLSDIALCPRTRTCLLSGAVWAGTCGLILVPFWFAGFILRRRSFWRRHLSIEQKKVLITRLYGFLFHLNLIICVISVLDFISELGARGVLYNLGYLILPPGLSSVSGSLIFFLPVTCLLV